MAFDYKAMHKPEQGVLICAGLILVLSFFSSYVTMSASGQLGGLSLGISAWHSYAALGLLLLLGSAAVVAVRAAGVQLPTIPVGWAVVVAACAGLGALLLIVRALTYSGGYGGVVSVGPGWSGLLLMLLAVAETVFAVLALRASGEKVEWRSGTTPTQTPPGPTA